MNKKPTAAYNVRQTLRNINNYLKLGVIYNLKPFKRSEIFII